MGRHRDPQTLDFIRKLKEKGESLGYETEDEYEMLGGLYAADLVWKLAKEQDPLVTFEVETEDNPRVFRNIMKYFDTLSSEITKPYRHFLIVIKGELSQGTRKPLRRYIDQYNVSLFENVANDERNQKSLFDQLDELKVRVGELVARYLSSGKIDETFREIIAGIQRGMPSELFEAKNVTITVSSGDRNDPLRPHKVRITTTTEQGQPTLIQKMNDALRTGEKVVLTKESGIRVELPGLGEVKPDWVEIRAEKILGFPMRLETLNYASSIELMMSRGKDTSEYLSLTNDNQDAPYRAELRYYEAKNQVGFNLHLDLNKANCHQSYCYFEFMCQAKKENRLILRGTKNEIVYDGAFPDNFEVPPEHYVSMLKILADIQLKTNVELPTPASISKEEMLIISRLQNIVSKGEEEGQLQTLTVHCTREQAQRRLYLANHPELIDNFQAIQNNSALELFGKQISLGQSTIIVPEARIDLKRLKNELEKGTEPMVAEVSATSHKPVRMVYTRWQKR